ncbi:lipoprotein insertase outer membrane protein LolB [Flavobacterium sp. JP2137]|uniref:lipoprotein insertase outer membrane protein LolB n=1 Tax=Flavobacterium sp. JP2137 TaxID=3414510 RepID=UPI003D2FCCBF
MKKAFAFTLLILSLAACKTVRNTGTDVSESAATQSKTVLNIVNGHYKNSGTFKTALIRGNTNYKGNGQSFTANTEIRIEKDKQILLTVKMLGFTVAKALITQDKVQYYEKMNSAYFEGDYRTLSQWLGTDLDFQKVQNLLLGHAINDLTKEKLVASLEDGLHKLQSTTNKGLAATYYFENEDLLLKKEAITQKNENRSVTISYPGYQKAQNITLPTKINIEAAQEKTIHLSILYNQATFDEELSFSYSVPSDYKRISIN